MIHPYPAKADSIPGAKEKRQRRGKKQTRTPTPGAKKEPSEPNRPRFHGQHALSIDRRHVPRPADVSPIGVLSLVGRSRLRWAVITHGRAGGRGGAVCVCVFDTFFCVQCGCPAARCGGAASRCWWSALGLRVCDARAGKLARMYYERHGGGRREEEQGVLVFLMCLCSLELLVLLCSPSLLLSPIPSRLALLPPPLP